jgi:hypothetical protein
MKLRRRKFLRLAAGAAALPAISQIARAQASRPPFEIKVFSGNGVKAIFGPSLARSSAAGDQRQCGYQHDLAAAKYQLYGQPYM